jgi:hypothetical protein
MMSPTAELIQLLHPDPKKAAPRISLKKYEAVRAAIMKAVSQQEDGILFKDLDAEVARLLSPDTLENLGSVSWYTISVKLDLEARGVIERIPGTRLQRIRVVR